MKSQEVERETRRKTKLEKELQAAKVDLEVRGSEVKQKQHQLQQVEEEHCRTEQQLKEARVSTFSISFFTLLFAELYLCEKLQNRIFKFKFFLIKK